MSRPGALDDPDLPILAELRDDLRSQLDSAFGPQRPRRSARTGARSRAARRVPVLAAVLLVVGASAIAEQTVLRDDDSPETPPTALGAARAGGEQWRMTAYRHESDVCHALLVAGTVASACGVEPPAGGVRATSLVTAEHRYVVGLAGRRVAAVRIEVGDATRRVRTRTPDATTIERAKLPAGLRWFVAALPRRDGTDAAAALLTAEDARRRALGAPVLDCTVGQSAPACRRLERELADP